MAQGILISTEHVWITKDYDEPLYKTIHEDLDDIFEVVHLQESYVMLVGDSSLLRMLPMNRIASMLYHFPIFGNAILMKEGIVDGEPDLIGLDEADIDYWNQALGILRQLLI